MGSGRGSGRAWHRPPATLIATAAAAIVLGATALGLLTGTPAGQGAAREAVRLTEAVSSATRNAPAAPPSLPGGRFFDGTPAVGALFKLSAGRLGGHFCTAGVVDSPHGDLLITAAHCVCAMSAGRIAFVPGYHDGKRPFGTWLVSRVIVDNAWAAGHDPDHDVAFLVARRQAAGTLQARTGGERLGTGLPAREFVRVIGYPDSRQRPLRCAARTRPLGGSQLEFDCAGFSDGTSGSPFLAHVGRVTGKGTVIGVIGGYKQGGDVAAVSHSARFGAAIRALYQVAVARS